MKRLFMLIAVGAMLLGGCSKNEVNEGKQPETPVTPDEPSKIPINVGMSVWTRVTDSSFEQNDKVGIYVVNYDGTTAGTLGVAGNHVNNMCFTYSPATRWTPDEEIYWKDNSTKADFYCYYPYGSPTNVGSYAITTSTDQSTDAGYKGSEFLWGKRESVLPTSETVAITVTHTMSNILVYVKPGTGFTEETLGASTVSVKICNVKTDATVNLATGAATATGSGKSVIPHDESGYYRALIVPQTVSANTALVIVTVNDVQYTYTPDKDIELKSNTQHKFTVTVNKVGSGVDIGVGSWTTDETDYGGSAE